MRILPGCPMLSTSLLAFSQSPPIASSNSICSLECCLFSVPKQNDKQGIFYREVDHNPDGDLTRVCCYLQLQVSAVETRT